MYLHIFMPILRISERYVLDINSAERQKSTDIKMLKEKMIKLSLMQL